MEEQETYEVEPEEGQPESYLGDDNQPADEPDQESAAAEPSAPTQYSADEMREIGIDKLDPERIPKELVPFYKSMQADYTRKTQQIAEERRRVEEDRRRAEENAKREKTIYDHYDEDPRGTEQYLNQEIKRLAEEDPFGNAYQIEQLRDLKIELKQTASVRAVERQNRFVSELVREVPDFTKKSDILTRFAVERLGMSLESLTVMTNPKIVGERAAIEQVKAINALYEEANAKATLSTKEVKKVTPVERAGTGEPQAKGPNIQKLKEEGHRTGDFTKYYEAIGVL